MNTRDVVETPVWQLLQKGLAYNRQEGVFVDTDQNYRFYNGDQWDGVKLGGIQPVQINFIKPIVKYKCAVVHSNLYGVVYSSMNFENREFRPFAEGYCKLLNRHMARVWELDKMDMKLRKVTKDAAINDEGIIWSRWDAEEKRPVHEVLKKNDVFYGNENDEDIQNQPYILIRKRMSQISAVELAREEGLAESKLELIIGDKDTMEESGDAAKREVDDCVTIVYKLYKVMGKIKYDIAARYVTIAQKVNTGLSLYPLAHMTWEEKEGSARGEGEVRNLIPNQIEVNKTEMRRVLTAKNQAYPFMVVDESKVKNPDQLYSVGGVIKTKDKTVDDVRKVVGRIEPAQMSPDVKMLLDDLVQISRDLAGAGDAATGQINPEDASGKAILAVQNASQAPMTEQKENFKCFVEDIAKIDMDMYSAYSQEGMTVIYEAKDAQGQPVYQPVQISQVALQALKLVVKIDITPKSAYDKFAQERTLENFLLSGMFSPQKLAEFKVYVNALDDDAVAPKQKLLQIIADIEQTQQKIAQMQAAGQLLQQQMMQALDRPMPQMARR